MIGCGGMGVLQEMKDEGWWNHKDPKRERGRGPSYL